jgi:hypothetical protein
MVPCRALQDPKSKSFKWKLGKNVATDLSILTHCKLNRVHK